MYSKMNNGLLITALFILLLNHGAALTEEVTRKLCPPMNKVNPPVNRVNTLDRIKRLREEMTNTRSVQGAPLDGYLITRFDEYMNEYVADRDKRLQYISGYTGNYGLAVVTKTNMIFWTDEMHHQLADNELSCNWTLYKTDVNAIASAAAEWLLHNLQSGNRVGADPKLVPNSEWEAIGRTVAGPSKSILVMPVMNNLIDFIWAEGERPAALNSVAYVWPEEYAGKAWKDKLNRLRDHLKGLDFDAMVITSLSEIGWLLNIRGSDLPYGPFLKAICIVSKDQLHLYTHLEKLTEEVRKHLYTESCVSAHCTRLHEYDAIWNDVRKMSQQWKKVLFPAMSHFSAGVSRQIFISVSLEKRRALPSPLIIMMAEKNVAERAGMKLAHIRDAVTFCNFSAFLVNEMQRSSENWDELYLVNLTNEFRSNDPLLKGISYPTVIATGSHTGLPMYVPTNETSMMIEKGQLLVIDAGAHYLDGTTSLARTFRLEPSSIAERDIEVYTRLLIGLINMASLAFPPQLTTSQLDVIARTPLWDAGYDYPHGSGHGIGVFSNVNESPIDIHYKNGLNDTLKAGYFILAETGFYMEGDFGMKLSCVLEVVYKNDSSGYLSFEPVTVFPFETRMINITLLSIQQKSWLNAYNDQVRSLVAAELLKQGLNNAYNWVVDRTEPIKLVEEEEDNSALTLGANSILKYFLIITFIVRFIMNI